MLRVRVMLLAICTEAGTIGPASQPARIKNPTLKDQTSSALSGHIGNHRTCCGQQTRTALQPHNLFPVKPFDSISSIETAIDNLHEDDVRTIDSRNWLNPNFWILTTRRVRYLLLLSADWAKNSSCMLASSSPLTLNGCVATRWPFCQKFIWLRPSCCRVRTPAVSSCSPALSAGINKSVNTSQKLRCIQNATAGTARLRSSSDQPHHSCTDSTSLEAGQFRDHADSRSPF